MVTRSNAWWMTRTKGIYIFSLTPFRQRAFAGFGKEMTNLAKLHWTGAVYFASLAGGAWYLKNWAEHYYERSQRKNLAHYDEEYAHILQTAPEQSGEAEGGRE